MFDAVARRYDVTNTVLSLGQDRLWRQATRRALAPKPGERILDLAAGTAVSSAPLAQGRRRGGGRRFQPRHARRRAPPAGRRSGRPPTGSRCRSLTGHSMRRPSPSACATSPIRCECLTRAAPGRSRRRPPGRLRVLPPGVGAVSHGVRRVPDAGAADRRPRGVEQSRRLRLPGRIHPRLAGSGGARRAARAGGLERRRLAQPDRRNRGAAPGGAPASRPPPTGPASTSPAPARHELKSPLRLISQTLVKKFTSARERSSTRKLHSRRRLELHHREGCTRHAAAFAALSAAPGAGR